MKTENIRMMWIIILIITLSSCILQVSSQQPSHIFVLFDEGESVPSAIRSKPMGAWASFVPDTHQTNAFGKLTKNSITKIIQLAHVLLVKYPFSGSDFYALNCIDDRETSGDAIKEFGGKYDSNTPLKNLKRFPGGKLNADNECHKRTALLNLTRHKSSIHQRMSNDAQYKKLLVDMKLYTHVDVDDANFLNIVTELRSENKALPTPTLTNLLTTSDRYLNDTFRLNMGLVDNIMHNNIDVGKEIRDSRISEVFSTIYSAIEARKRDSSGSIKMDAYATVSKTIYAILIEFGLDKVINELDDYFPYAGVSIIFEFYDNFQTFKLVRIKDRTDDLTSQISGCNQFCNYSVLETISRKYTNNIFDCSITDPSLYYISNSLKVTTESSDSSKAEPYDVCACGADNTNRPSYCKNECGFIAEYHGYIIIGLLCLLMLFVFISIYFWCRSRKTKKMEDNQTETKNELTNSQAKLTDEFTAIEVEKGVVDEQQEEKTALLHEDEKKQKDEEAKQKAKDDVLTKQKEVFQAKTARTDKYVKAARVLLRKKLTELVHAYAPNEIEDKNTYTESKKKNNKDKIRCGLGVADKFRVKLNFKGEPDFINACFIPYPGPTNSRMIAAQAPMSNTIRSFWLMVLQLETDIVIQMGIKTEVEEDGVVEQFARYFPDQNEEPVRDGTGGDELKVTCTMKSGEDQGWWIIKRDLVVQYKGKKHVVTHYQWVDWLWGRGPTVISAGRQMFDIVNGAKTPVVVACKDGASSSGAFIHMCATAQANVDPLPTNFDSVNRLRQRRADAVGSQAEWLAINLMWVYIFMEEPAVVYGLKPLFGGEDPKVVRDKWIDAVAQYQHQCHTGRIEEAIAEEKKKAEEASKKTKTVKSGKSTK